MNHFVYRKGRLFCERVPLGRIASKVGTPCYVYSHETLKRHYFHLLEAWDPLDVIVTYAVKANSNIAILALFEEFGSWADVVSAGEIYRALQAGFSPSRIVFGGVGKTEAEIGYAVRRGVFLIVADSPEELELLDKHARRQGRVVNVAIRINPDIDPKTHPHIATGLKVSKFGVEARAALDAFRKARTCRSLNVIGIHHHIGSQITELEPFSEAFKKTVALVRRLRRLGLPIEYLNIGGGIGITYRDESVFSFEELARTLAPVIQALKIKLMMEPGRVLVGNAGILLTRVTYFKKSYGKSFLIVDAGMNDLIRPVLYGAYHEIKSERVIQGRIRADVVGPICESGDFFARDRSVPKFKAGDLMAIMSAGAYGFSMSSNYNSRARAAEVLVKGRDLHVIRRRESFADLVRGEKIPRNGLRRR